MPFIWHIFGYFAKNPYLILSHLSLGLLMFIAQSLLSKTSELSESTVPINLHHCNPYKVLVHSADVAASQGCSCDSFSMTLCTFKHRKRICTYLSHIYKDFIIILDYVRLSRNLYIHYVRLSRNLYIHYVRLRPTYFWFGKENLQIGKKSFKHLIQHKVLAANFQPQRTFSDGP